MCGKKIGGLFLILPVVDYKDVPYEWLCSLSATCWIAYYTRLYGLSQTCGSFIYPCVSHLKVNLSLLRAQHPSHWYPFIYPVICKLPIYISFGLEMWKSTDWMFKLYVIFANWSQNWIRKYSFYVFSAHKGTMPEPRNDWTLKYCTTEH